MRITRDAIEYVEEMLESKQAQIDELEEELAEALDEVASLRARIQLMMADRSVAV